jgi:hypothetical protein
MTRPGRPVETDEHRLSSQVVESRLREMIHTGLPQLLPWLLPSSLS